MPAFVCLLYDPREKITDILSAFRKHPNRDHIEHLYSLIEFSIEASQIDGQQHQISKNRAGKI